jgi:hypothetical protein
MQMLTPVIICMGLVAVTAWALIKVFSDLLDRVPYDEPSLSGPHCGAHNDDGATDESLV